MKKQLLLSVLFALIGLFIDNVKTENAYYIVSIRRNETDKSYDNETGCVQSAIDELVNERMNDIYNIIRNNQDTYILKDGLIDEKLDEFEAIPVLVKKRDDNVEESDDETKIEDEIEEPEKLVFNFVNKNRPSRNVQSSNVNKNTNYVSIESKLISHICPISNYYAIKVYLSDDIIDKVKNLDNIISCRKSSKLEKPTYKITHNGLKKFNSNPLDKRASSDTYYDIDYIKKETGWSDVSVQKYAEEHLALLSQNKYNDDLVNRFDDNYYYPSSAGKGIDIYLIDEGITVNHEEFDTYKGKSYERTVTCDAIIEDGNINVTKGDSKKKCSIGGYQEHGTIVASVAAGVNFGVAKKANIHMLATDFYDYDFTAALDYIKIHGIPHKTIISVSRNGVSFLNRDIQNKINEMVDAGFLIFASSGNEGEDACDDEYVNKFAGYKNVITVGASADGFSLDDAYRAAYYSNFGKCIDLHAPGAVEGADFDGCSSSLSKICSNSCISEGTSFSTPIVSGIAALIMSENSGTKYNYKSMLKTLIDMSVKNALTNLGSNDTPNRLANNGKHIVYSSDKNYEGCGILAGNSKCSSGCCSIDGYCINPNKDSKGLCKISNGCQSEFGTCGSSSTIVSPIDSYGMTLDSFNKAMKTSSTFESTFLSY
ncbi:subtilisin-like protein [Neocallimastix californiae]|uniref:Subtilisin-like protein n=1 Tax=Neocallimastix californiae TaxID=1754190 RepID=A0A1Y2AJH2_9FUNG|nr:subtilisin-like protein [Neocallimastix californiae]|eukprot:ORY22718.1 subtilisin-like protein [Neocallimastix californiae]